MLTDLRQLACYTLAVHKEWLGVPLWLVFGVLGAWIATTKGRGGCFWFLMCSFLGPIGLVIAAVVPRTDD
jgi:ABC-type sulfate transport system permease subunit